MHVVTFYVTDPTHPDGQRVAATVKFDPSWPAPHTVGDVRLEGLLFDRGQADEDADAVVAAMRDAPRRFDGAYLRASCEEVE